MRKDPKLKLADLVVGLDRFGQGYKSIRAFADDLREALPTAPAVAGLRKLDDEGRTFLLAHGGRDYHIEVLAEAGGVVRLERATVRHAVEGPAAQRLGGSNVAKARLHAYLLRGEGAEASPVLGLLVGEPLIRGAGPDAPRRILPLQFEVSSRQWRPYTGGLVPWLKQQMLTAA